MEGALMTKLIVLTISGIVLASATTDTWTGFLVVYYSFVATGYLILLILFLLRSVDAWILPQRDGDEDIFLQRSDEE